MTISNGRLAIIEYQASEVREFRNASMISGWTTTVEEVQEMATELLRLRADNARLLAAREEVETSLAEFCYRVRNSGFKTYGLITRQSGTRHNDGDERVRDVAERDMRELGLWRAPRAAEATDSNGGEGR